MFLCVPLHILSCGWGASPAEKMRHTSGMDLLTPVEAITNNTINMSEELRQLAEQIANNTIFCTKEILTSEEAAKYLGISRSYLYKLTMERRIPHFKPMGKLCYFNRQELEQWLQTNRVATTVDIEQQAQDYCLKKGGHQ